MDRFGIRLYLFTLMSNHVHLVFETPTANCSAFMQSLLTAYTVYYNIRHQRHGHLFDGRYKAKLVEGDCASGEYLLALSRYVHLNPVRVGKLKDAPLARTFHQTSAAAPQCTPPAALVAETSIHRMSIRLHRRSRSKHHTWHTLRDLATRFDEMFGLMAQTICLKGDNGVLPVAYAAVVR